MQKGKAPCCGFPVIQTPVSSQKHFLLRSDNGASKCINEPLERLHCHSGAHWKGNLANVIKISELLRLSLQSQVIKGQQDGR